MIKKIERYKRGFTLIELLVVMAVMAIIIFPLILTYRNARANQALRASGEGLADVVRTAHIYGREAREKQSWGVKSEGNNKYSLIYGQLNTEGLVEQEYSLEPGITFDGEFIVWFAIGTGESETGTQVKVVNENGKKSLITVYKTGVVEVTRDD